MGINCPKCHFDNPDDSKFCKECGTQIISSEEIPVSPAETLETPKEELTTGSVFAGRYQIIEVLGKGGMGKIYEQKGWKGKAVEHYQKFLDLWKGADPGIAEVEDARKRLAGLLTE